MDNMKIECVCIDDSNRPEEVKLSCWPKKGQTYHITWIYLLMSQNELQGCDLAEIKMDESCYPYVCYKLSRFAIRPEDQEKIYMLAKACTDAGEISSELEKILEEEIVIQ